MSSTVRYADICVNLLNGQFRNDTDAVVERARQAGVAFMVITTTDIDSAQAAQALSAPPHQLCTAGIHPHDIGTAAPNWQHELKALASHAHVAAIGETGLDFNRNYSSKDAQLNGFRHQIELAIDLGKPLFVHDRDSNGEVLRLLKDYKAALPKVVIHCFTGTETELQDYLAEDFYIGITGWISDTRRGGALRDMAHLIPDERLLVETDAPFLRPHNAPEDFIQTHGLSSRYKRRNEPALLPAVVEALAAARQVDPAQLAEQTYANALRFFNVEPAAPAPGMQ